jgi:hypothetical protein
MEARSSRNRLPATSASVEPDHGPRNAAILSFATVIVLLLVAYVALFDVDSTVEKIIFATVVLGAIGAAVVVHRVSTPTGQLPHRTKVRREQRHVAMLNGVLAAVLLLLVYTAAFDLNSWAEWTVFGAIVLTAVGAGIAVQTHLRQPARTLHSSAGRGGRSGATHRPLADR